MGRRPADARPSCGWGGMDRGITVSIAGLEGEVLPRGSEHRRTVLSSCHDFGWGVDRRGGRPGSFVCRFGACPDWMHLRNHAADEDPPDRSVAAFGRPE